jgi:hypothetical protein
MFASRLERTFEATPLKHWIVKKKRVCWGAISYEIFVLGTTFAQTPYLIQD